MSEIDKYLDALKPDQPLGGADKNGKYQFVYTVDGEDEPEALRQMAMGCLGVMYGNEVIEKNRRQLVNIVERLCFLAETKNGLRN